MIFVFFTAMASVVLLPLRSVKYSPLYSALGLTLHNVEIGLQLLLSGQ
ncbi:MAG: hypothetical protein HOP11_04560 [Saprospiraceae bacterium]|nr:hypothetical protein [Saprospiraceae bacterium]